MDIIVDMGRMKGVASKAHMGALTSSRSDLAKHLAAATTSASPEERKLVADIGKAVSDLDALADKLEAAAKSNDYQAAQNNDEAIDLAADVVGSTVARYFEELSPRVEARSVETGRW